MNVASYQAISGGLNAAAQGFQQGRENRRQDRLQALLDEEYEHKKKKREGEFKALMQLAQHNEAVGEAFRRAGVDSSSSLSEVHGALAALQTAQAMQPRASGIGFVPTPEGSGYVITDGGQFKGQFMKPKQPEPFGMQATEAIEIGGRKVKAMKAGNSVRFVDAETGAPFGAEEQMSLFEALLSGRLPPATEPEKKVEPEPAPVVPALDPKNIRLYP